MRFFRNPKPHPGGAPLVSVRDLKQRLDRSEEVLVLDVRQQGGYEAFPGTIPGSIRILAAELPERYGELPHDRPIVAFCT